VKEHPILFSSPIIRAILESRKSQTRRIIKPQPELSESVGFVWKGRAFGKAISGGEEGTRNNFIRSHIGKSPVCPYGVPGDKLWVKEAWRVGNTHDERTPNQIWEHLTEIGRGVTVLYEAGGWRSIAPVERVEVKYEYDKPMPGWAGRKRSSMFMPRLFSRITLEITDVRVQRLNEISDEDCIAEGIDYDKGTMHCANYLDLKDDERIGRWLGPKGSYASLWEKINGKGSWDANPWLWCLSFRMI
jgi:hypothetical protein